MTRTEIKHRAQDELMHWLCTAFTAMREAEEAPEVIAEAEVQARRVAKLFGFDPDSFGY